MLNEVKKIPAFMMRDLRMLSTYKLAFSMSYLNIIFNLFYFVLFGSVFSASGSSVLTPYGGDYISYLLVGSVGWGFLWSIMGTTSGSLRSEMMMGTVESILLTKTRMVTMMFSYALYGSFFGLLSIILLVGIGFIFFNVSVFATANIFTLIIFIFSTAMMFGFGLIFAGLTIWLKNIGAVSSVIQSISMFFCGVYFPLTVLPEFLRPIAMYIPFYYPIEGLRRSLITTTPSTELITYSCIVLGLAVFFILLGIYILHKGLIKAKKDGSLMFY